MHLLEALTRYYSFSNNEIGLERLSEIITIQIYTVVRKSPGFSTDKYQGDWRLIFNTQSQIINYGHILENIRLLILEYEAAGRPVFPLVELSETIFNNYLKYGFDRS